MSSSYLDDSQTDAGAALRRFVTVGEGRTDHFSSYTDGCALWGDIHASGACGVIRGDESIGGGRPAASTDAAAGVREAQWPPTTPLGTSCATSVSPTWNGLSGCGGDPEKDARATIDRIEQQYELPNVLAALHRAEGAVRRGRQSASLRRLSTWPGRSPTRSACTGARTSTSSNGRVGRSRTHASRQSRKHRRSWRAKACGRPSVPNSPRRAWRTSSRRKPSSGCSSRWRHLPTATGACEASPPPP